MTVRELATQLKLEVCCGAAGLDKEIKGGYTSDLLSDVMGNAREGNIWITLQTHKNIMPVSPSRSVHFLQFTNVRDGIFHRALAELSVEVSDKFLQLFGQKRQVERIEFA